MRFIKLTINFLLCFLLLATTPCVAKKFVYDPDCDCYVPDYTSPDIQPPASEPEQKDPTKKAQFTAQTEGDLLLKLPVDWGIGNNAKAEWNSIEGYRHFLNPEHARNFVMTVCNQHFAVGTQGRANLEEAVRKINSVSGVDIEISIKEGPHLSATAGSRGLYAKPPNKEYANERMRVEMTHLNPKTTLMDATASAFFYFEDFNGAPDWRWGPRGQPKPRKSDYVVIALNSIRPKGYPAYVSNPNTEIDKAPSIGVLSHEIGHALHFGHDIDRQFTKALARPFAERLFVGQSVSRGGTIFHGGNFRTGGVSAYSKALLRHYYPKPGTTARDEKPQWYNHEILLVEDPVNLGNIKTIAFQNYNPSMLRHNNKTDLYYDCATGERPVFRMQYSDASDRNCRQVRENEVEIAITYEDTHLASRSNENQDCAVDFVQYDWQRTVTIRGAQVGTPPTGGTRQIALCSRVDPQGLIKEFDESDNRRCMPVTLISSDVMTRDCPKL